MENRAETLMPNAGTSAATVYSRTSKSFALPNEPFIVISTAETRAREIGLCAMDLSAPHELLIWTIIDSHSYAEAISLLQTYQPSEILVVKSRNAHGLNQEVMKHFSTSMCRVVPLERKYFNQTQGTEDLRRIKLNHVDLNISQNYVAMAATSSLLRYIEYTQGVHIASNTVKVVLNPSSQKLLLDQSTISALELVRNARNSNVKQSLCGILDTTQTSTGYRLLRSTILQPTCHLKTIHDRQEMVSVFLDNPGWFFDVTEELQNFKALDRILHQLVVVPKQTTAAISRSAISSVISLKNVLACLPQLASALTSSRRELEETPALLHAIIESLQNDTFDVIRNEIDRVFSENVQVCRSAAQKRIQESFAVRPGIDGMLDVARRTYLDTVNRIHEVAHRYEDQSDLPIRLHYTARRGYHLKLQAGSAQIPTGYIEVVHTNKEIMCTTRELQSLNARAHESMNAVFKRSADTVQDLLNNIRPYAATMYAMAESIALLDMLLSFVNVVALAPPTQPYVRPKLNKRGNLVIQAGRHALVERVLDGPNYVANDTFFDPLTRFHSTSCDLFITSYITDVVLVITGANCAGKSTYLRTVALITILAQMGSYVPASKAFIPIRDRICTRFGTSDNMEENASTFVVEMSETAFILDTCTPQSLVLIDELGRGTANDEGSAIAWSVSEQLIAKGAYTLFATHYTSLNRLAELYSSCRCYHLASEEHENYVQLRHKVEDGPCPSTGQYGIKTAAMCGLPQDIIQEAFSTYDRLANMTGVNESNGLNYPPMRYDKRLLHRLLALRYADMDVQSLRKHLQHLHEEFLRNEEEEEESTL